jgi:hypothetical protein
MCLLPPCVQFTENGYCFIGHGVQPEKKSNVPRFGLKVGFVIAFSLDLTCFDLISSVPRIWQRFKLSFIICFAAIAMMIIFTTDLVPFEWQIPGWNWALIIPLALVVGCHSILLPVSPIIFFYFYFFSTLDFVDCS